MTKEKHEINLLTSYCIHCGTQIVGVVHKLPECHRHENVIAISHIRAMAILNDQLRTTIINYNPTPK